MNVIVDYNVKEIVSLPHQNPFSSLQNMNMSGLGNIPMSARGSVAGQTTNMFPMNLLLNNNLEVVITIKFEILKKKVRRFNAELQ